MTQTIADNLLVLGDAALFDLVTVWWSMMFLHLCTSPYSSVSGFVLRSAAPTSRAGRCSTPHHRPAGAAAKAHDAAVEASWEQRACASRTP